MYARSCCPSNIRSASCSWNRCQGRWPAQNGRKISFDRKSTRKQRTDGNGGAGDTDETGDVPDDDAQETEEQVAREGVGLHSQSVTVKIGNERVTHRLGAVAALNVAGSALAGGGDSRGGGSHGDSRRRGGRGAPRRGDRKKGESDKSKGRDASEHVGLERELWKVCW